MPASRPLPVVAIVLLLAACGGQPEPPRQAAAPMAPVPASEAAPVAVPPAATTPVPAAAITLPVVPPLRSRAWRDDLRTPAAVSLNGRAVPDVADATWSATGIAVGPEGATTSGATPGGGHLTIPAVAGTIVLAADLRPTGSGFAALALGHGNLSGDFWKSYDLLFLVRAGGYSLLAGKTELVPKIDAALVRADGFNRLELCLDTRARTVTATLNGRVVVDAKPLPAGTVAQAPTAAGFRFNEPVTAGTPAARALELTVESTAVAGLEALDIGAFAVLPDRPATLAWRMTSRGPRDAVDYELSDYSGTVTTRGVAPITPSGALELTVTLPRGYAEVTFPEAQQSFGIIALEPLAGAADPFFGIDAALSWLETRPAMRDGLVRLLARSGIRSARERLSMGAVAKGGGTYDWKGGERDFAAMRALYAAHGIGVLEILHGTPGHHGVVKPSPYPQDLRAAATDYAALAGHWGGGWDGAEIWNEPDLLPLPAEQYATVAKTAAWALAASGRPVVTGVIATVPPGGYFTTLNANDLLAVSDVFSFHQYDPTPTLASQVQRYRAFLAAGGRGSLPLWLTECGQSWTIGPARPPLSQDRLSAVEIAAKGIEAKACGVARYYPFVLPFYEEGGIKSFSMMGREVTPLRAMAAYVFSVAALSGWDYVGDLRLDDAPAVRLARVFARGQERVAVLYAGLSEKAEKAADAAPTARLPRPARRLAGADGRALTSSADGTVSLADGLAYAWYDAADLTGLIDERTLAADLLAASRAPQAPHAAPSPLVLQFPIEHEPGRATVRCHLIDQATAKALRVPLRLDNLGDTPLTVTPRLRLPGEDGAGRALAPVTVPARGRSEVEWTVDASAALDVAEVRHVVVTVDGAPGCTPLAIPLVVEGDLATHLARHAQRVPLPVGDLPRWSQNAGGGADSRFTAEGGTWRMTIGFKPGVAPWAFPHFALPAPMDPTVATGLVVRARIMKPANPVGIILNGADGEDFRAMDLFPADGQWHVVYVPFEEFKPGPVGMQNSRLDLRRIRTIGPGMVSRNPDNVFEISDLVVVGDAPRSAP